MVKPKKKSQQSKKRRRSPPQASQPETPTLSLKERLAQKRKATLARKEFTSLLTAKPL